MSGPLAPALLLDRVLPPDDLAEFHGLPKAAQDGVLRWFGRLAPLLGQPKGACKRLAALAPRWGVSFPTAYRHYQAAAARDWRALVDTRLVPRLQKRTAPEEVTLPERPEFLGHVGRLFGRNQRKCRPAYGALLRQWRQWRAGNAAKAIPGYTVCPPAAANGKHPAGWSYPNLMRLAKPSRAELKIARVGSAAAAEFLPKIPGTRAGLRFLEYVLFDDVWPDRKVVLPGYRDPARLLQLGCQDWASAVYLKWGLRPELPLADGTRERLKERDMLALVAAFLCEYGYPLDYPMHLVLERGTATLRAADAKALFDYTGGLVRVCYTGMQGELVLAWQEAPTGNPRGKGLLESWHNLYHNESADLDGQMGMDRDHQPAALPDREREARLLNDVGRVLTPHQRARRKMPFPGLDEAHAQAAEVIARINGRDAHAMEGFGRTSYWRIKGAPGMDWQPESALAALPESALAAVEYDSRPESPMQRMARLSQGTRFGRLPGFLLRSFVEDRRAVCRVDRCGIAFKFEGKNYEYLPAAPEQKLAENTELVAHFSPFDLGVVHLTDGKGGFVGSWKRFGPFGRTNAEKAEANRIRRAYLDHAVRNVRRRHALDIDAEAQRQEDNLAVIAEAGLIPVPGARTLAEVQAHCTPGAEALQRALQDRRKEHDATRRTGQVAPEPRCPSPAARSPEHGLLALLGDVPGGDLGGGDGFAPFASRLPLPPSAAGEGDSHQTEEAQGDDLSLLS